MKILIATGIYPPDIGGPAQYAYETEQAFKRAGHEVTVLAFRLERKLPTGIRHLYYFLRVIFSLRGVDLIFSPDTWSAALPATIAAKIFGKKIILRTGGDFLWEWYVERTGDMVLLKDFYTTRLSKLNLKERSTLRLLLVMFRWADITIFSTAWQRDLFAQPYRLDSKKCVIVENYYGEKIGALPCARKNFIAGSCPLKWKNAERVMEAFALVKGKGVEAEYDGTTTPHTAFLEKIRSAYAVMVVTLGDISPNTILDAIRSDKPFIMTTETGFTERLKDIAIFVNPEDTHDIAEKIEWLSDENNYKAQQTKIRAFPFRHSWDEIVEEILSIYHTTS